MEVVSADPYELKLLQMFESCDKEGSGSLNEDSLRQLCTQLELSDKGAALIANLAAEEESRQNVADKANTKTRKIKVQNVTFEKFKEALLNFLGTETDIHTTTTTAMIASAAPTITMIANKERSLFISDEADTSTSSTNKTSKAFIESPPLSPDREVSPKLVRGSKKYGRRSRPSNINTATKHHPQGLNELSPSDSEGNCEDLLGGNGHRHCQSTLNCDSNKMALRSCSQSDINRGQAVEDATTPCGRRASRTLNANGNGSGGKLKRCASLPAQRISKGPQKVKASEIQNLQAGGGANLSSSVESLGNINNKLTRRVHEIWDTYAKQLGHHRNSYSNVDNFESDILCEYKFNRKESPTETLTVHEVIDIWDRAQIPNGKNILLALGFDEDEINLVQLNKVFEEELRGLENDEQMYLVRASLALQAAELTTLRQTQRQLQEENRKLHKDNKEANRRVSLLALEIDERHASLEDSAKKEIHLLEQRHANIVRDLTTRMTNDKEHWNNLSAHLESRIKTFEQDEIKLKTELELTQRENADLENLQQKLEKQVAELLEKNIKLTQELSDMEENSKSGDYNRHSLNAAQDEDDLLQLMDKISALQLENKNLRDKNDELVAEVENLNLDLIRIKAKGKKSSTPTPPNPAEEEAEHNSLNSSSSVGTTATKRRGDSPSKTHITEESPRTGKLRKCNGNEDDPSTVHENSDHSGEWMALDSELQQSRQEEAKPSSKEELEAKLKKALEEKSKAEDRCKELEASLEQMQRAYEDCEDYWQAKLSEERQLFEKERQIYEEEQQESDKKFTDLMEKVREYEEQFSKDGRLSPIEENQTLEQQYIFLEAEAEEVRENAKRMLEEKSKEIDALQREIEDLRVRLGESVEILTGASELTNAAQRASVDLRSPASSPINYLWQQSTILEPAKNLHTTDENDLAAVKSLSSKQLERINLSTSETTVFSTTPFENNTSSPKHNSAARISAIQKPTATGTTNSSMKTSHTTSSDNNDGDIADCETLSTSSGKSFETHSVASTHNNNKTSTTTTTNHTNDLVEQQLRASRASPSPSSLKDELKRLKFFEISLRDQIKDLSMERDGLVMELQQLQEAKPVLEKAYARTVHPSLMQRISQLELKNRHLQNVIKQQTHYTESLMQQSWQQHQMEIGELHHRIESQNSLLTEQAQRLQNSDILVKDLYVENSHLTAAVQQLELQQKRVNFMHQQHQMQHQQLLSPPHHLVAGAVPPQQQQRGMLPHHNQGLPGMP